MPSVFESLVRHQKLPETIAWRVAFVVPSILLLSVGLCVLLLCEDSPLGSWHTRPSKSISSSTADIVSYHGGAFTEKPCKATFVDYSPPSSRRPSSLEKGATPSARSISGRNEEALPSSFRHNLSQLFCMQTLMLALFYLATFGGALVINSLLVSFYLHHFPQWDQTKAGSWAAMSVTQSFSSPFSS